MTIENTNFRARSRLVQLLGDELIGSSRLAIFELVKNAYDADATRVSVVLNNLGSAEASIVVTDNGVGMGPDTVKNVWLVLAHDYRKRQRKAGIRSEFGRLPLGEKGLGRMAVHKLGERIELITRSAGSPEVSVIIDWDRLADAEMLSDAVVEVETRPPVVFDDRTGTRITIERLKNPDISRGEVRKLFRQITSITSPQRLITPERKDVLASVKAKGRADPGFKVSLSVPEHPEWLDLPDATDLSRMAPWEFWFRIVNGRIDWRYEFKGVDGISVRPRELSKTGEKLPVKATGRRSDRSPGSSKVGQPVEVVATELSQVGIGPIEGMIRAYDRDREVKQRMSNMQSLMQLLDEQGGVKLYRDGIRVYNYGEPEDDWLGLDLRRVNDPSRRLSRNITLGEIHLDLAASDGLVEKTNREGFVESDALDRLRELVLGAIDIFQTERAIDKALIRKVTGSPRKTLKSIDKPLEAIRRRAKKHKLQDEFEPDLVRIQREYDDIREAMLRAGLSNTGLAMVFHEVEQGISRLALLAAEDEPDLELLRKQLKSMVSLMDGFTALLQKSSVANWPLTSLVRNARDLVAPRLRFHSISLSAPCLEKGAWSPNANFAYSLVLGALSNLLDNSIYWLKVHWTERTDGQPSVFMDIQEDDDGSPVVLVGDNGPGFVDPPETLTTPFVTRKSEGMGLGLYYSSMAMAMSHGDLIFPDREVFDVPDRFDGALVGLKFGKA